MVTQARLTFGIALMGVSLNAGVVRADTLLEQMQNEVAAIAGRARGCIVSIEDPRAIVVSYNNSALEKSDLQNQLTHLLIDRKAAQEQSAQDEAKYRAGALTLLEVEKSRQELARLNLRQTYLQQTLANFGREDANAQQKRELDSRITLLEMEQTANAQSLKLLQQRVAAGLSPVPELQTAQQQEAHVLQDLTTAREQRKNSGQNPPSPLTFHWDTVSVNAPKSGSGFSVGDGYIVTTADVAQGMNSLIVTSDDGRRIRAALVAVDSERNVGLVRLASNATLPALTLGDSDRVMPGHFAISIGNQAGQYNSVALGLVSGIRTQGFYSGAHFYPNLLQVDGAVSVGTSGAPILNARGEVIGMIAATLAPDATPPASSGYTEPSAANTFMPDPKNPTRYLDVRTQIGDLHLQYPLGDKNTAYGTANRVTVSRPLTLGAGTGFAIPINAMKDVIEELKAGKDIVHAWFGVALEDVDDAREEKGAIRLNSQARIRGIYANSPASKVGLKVGDVLVSLEAKPVHATSEVRAAILPMKAGRKVNLIVQRAGKTMTFTLPLEVQPTPRPNLLLEGPVYQLNGTYNGFSKLTPLDKKKTPEKP